jgi:hypothetical protein
MDIFCDDASCAVNINRGLLFRMDETVKWREMG